MNLSDEGLAELFEQYKEEARETIETLDTKLVAIERDPTNSEVIFSLFRHLHSLKGSSKMFNVDNIAHIAHKLEDLMQLIDQDNSILSRFPKIVDLLFQGNDIFREILATLEEDVAEFNLTPEHARFIEQITHQLDLINRKESVLVEKGRILLDELEAVLPTLDEAETVGLRTAMRELLANLNMWAMGETGGNLRYTYGGLDMTPFMNTYQTGLEKLQSGTTSAEEVETFLQNVEALIQALFEVAEENIMDVLQELNDGLEMVRERSLEIDPIVVEFFSAVFGDLKKHVRAEADGSVARPAPEHAAGATISNGGDVSSLSSTNHEAKVKTIRVDEKKIDLFLDSVGKLIIQSEILNHLQYSFRQAGINPALVRDFSAINRSISNDVISLQKSIMEVRQVEINNILKKFPRLVRDISHKMDKEVDLAVSGERVPIDKSLLEDVEKALIHIVRNAIDHGLEAPDVREAAGKSRRGRITIGVEQEESSILIEVSDDGRGIDYGAIREKAFKRGLISRDEYENYSNNQLERLIFMSGVTTKAEATDISGRGVGLDVVQTNVRRWNGEVTLENRPGSGLTLRLRIPISHTLLTKEAIMLRVADQTFCVPLESVTEIVTVPSERIHTHKNQAVFQHRDQVISVLDIRGVLGLPPSDGAADGGTTFIILRGKLESRKAVVADEIVGQQKIVIKDFDVESLRKLRYCQGLTLLGDGRVVLVLDPENLVE